MDQNLSASNTLNQKITQSIYSAIDVINAQRTTAPVRKAPDLILFGSSSDLDSLELVNLIVASEQKIEEDFQKTIALVDERAFAHQPSPFDTVSTLANYIEVLLKESQS